MNGFGIRETALVSLKSGICHLDLPPSMSEISNLPSQITVRWRVAGAAASVPRYWIPHTRQTAACMHDPCGSSGIDRRHLAGGLARQLTGSTLSETRLVRNPWAAATKTVPLPTATPTPSGFIARECRAASAGSLRLK